MRTLKQLASLDGRVALITGGAGHIGVTAARTLAELGADIAVLDINQSSVEEASEAISREEGVQVLPLAINLSDQSSLSSVSSQIEREFGRLDVIVNSAALVGSSKRKGWVTDFATQGNEAWGEALDINLTSVFFLIQTLHELLVKTDNGAIINLSSIYGVVGPDLRLYDGTNMGNPAAYAASKGGLVQLTRWLATVLAPKVRVNSISPGGVFRNQPDEFCQRYIERTPMRRMATEEDLKGAIAYLATDLSSYVTGHNLIVDGGWTTW